MPHSRQRRLSFAQRSDAGDLGEASRTANEGSAACFAQTSGDAIPAADFWSLGRWEVQARTRMIKTSERRLGLPPELVLRSKDLRHRVYKSRPQMPAVSACALSFAYRNRSGREAVAAKGV